MQAHLLLFTQILENDVTAIRAIALKVSCGTVPAPLRLPECRGVCSTEHA